MQVVVAVLILQMWGTAAAAAQSPEAAGEVTKSSKPVAAIAGDVGATVTGDTAVDSNARAVPWLAVGASVVPGVLVHGTGHFVAGDTSNGYRLLAMEGVGLLSVASGLLVLRVVNGSEKLAPVFVPLTVGGVGLLATSLLADVAGTLHGERPWPLPRPPGALSVTGGYTGLFASKHTFSHLGRVGADWRLQRLSCGAAVTLHPTLDYAQYGGFVGWRLWAPQSDDQITKLSLLADLFYQRFRTEGFSETTFRGLGEFRWNMGYLITSMRNTWLLARMGWGIDVFSIDDSTNGADGLPFIVMDVGMGLMASKNVSIELTYRQRKGDLPGGIAISGGSAGFFGMLEFQGRVTIDPRWSVVPGLRVGNGIMPWIWVESSLF